MFRITSLTVFVLIVWTTTAFAQRGGGGGRGGGFGGRGGSEGGFGGRGGSEGGRGSGFGGRGGTEGGFGGRGGGFGGRGGSEGGFGGRGGGREGGFGGRGGSSEGGFGGRGGGFGGRGEGGGREGNSTKRKEKIRVAIAMPAEFAAGDLDQDGQIGLYEWKKWKTLGAIGQFMAMDRDHDGLLTPRELTSGPVAGATAEVAVATAADSSDSSANTKASDSSSEAATTTATPSSSSAPPASDALSQKVALRYFSILDRNKNGSVDPEEWARSTRLKPMFEGAGADLSQAMSKDDFVKAYVAAKSKS